MNGKISLRLFCLTISLALIPATIVGATELQNRSSPERTTNYAVLHVAELAAMLRQKDFFFVNVHIPYEGEIKSTDAFIRFDKISANLDKLPSDKAAKIVLYCRSGRMSAIAAGELTRLGYTNVSHLEGGMREWERTGHQLVTK
jgi:rhodanese-related sulfurtransferase